MKFIWNLNFFSKTKVEISNIEKTESVLKTREIYISAISRLVKTHNDFLARFKEINSEIDKYKGYCRILRNIIIDLRLNRN